MAKEGTNGGKIGETERWQGGGREGETDRMSKGKEIKRQRERKSR